MHIASSQSTKERYIQGRRKMTTTMARLGTSRASRSTIKTIIVASSFVLLIFAIMASRNKGEITRQSIVFKKDPKYLPDDVLKRLDAVLVLGGGVPTSVDEPPVYVQHRCDDAAVLARRYQELLEKKLPILTLSAGTAHLPQLMGRDGLPIWESTSSAAYLHGKHGLDDTVYVETTSYDTIGNAYFARTSHTDVNGWRRLLIVTNEFHMDRTKAIFDWIFGVDNDGGYELFYFASPDIGLTEAGLEARRTHERKGAESVRQHLAPQHSTLKDVWTFLHHRHDLYTASKLTDRARNAASAEQEVRSGALKESYGGKKQDGYQTGTH